MTPDARETAWGAVRKCRHAVHHGTACVECIAAALDAAYARGVEEAAKMVDAERVHHSTCDPIVCTARLDLAPLADAIRALTGRREGRDG